MSTANYSYKNICVVVHDGDQEDLEYWIDADICMFAGLLRDKVRGFKIAEGKRRFTENMDALILGGCEVINRHSGEVFAEVVATYKDGYYHGACLDYDVIYNDYYEAERQTSVENVTDKKCNAIAKVLKTFGVEIRKVAIFSDGEAIYEEVKRVTK